MNDREFWIQVRRGVLTIVAAIDSQHSPDPFWGEMRKGFTRVSRAIEYRYRLPIHSVTPIGGNGVVAVPDEPPAVPLARSSSGGIE